MLRLKWGNSISECYVYETIPLRVYFDIIKTGDRKLLIKSGSPSKSDLESIWEDIIRKNGKETNNFNYDIYFNALKNYGLLVNEYNLIKACILKLTMRPDKSVIELLKGRGYVIDVSSRTAYFNSIHAADQRSNNLMTKILSRQKEIERLTHKDGEPTTLPQAVARMNAALGYSAVTSETPLAEYNEYKKIIARKHGRDRKVGPIQR